MVPELAAAIAAARFGYVEFGPTVSVWAKTWKAVIPEGMSTWLVGTVNSKVPPEVPSVSHRP